MNRFTLVTFADQSKLVDMTLVKRRNSKVRKVRQNSVASNDKRPKCRYCYQKKNLR